MADTTRVQLDMPPKSMERLKRLRERTEASSYAEVIRDALRLYEFAINETEAGRRIKSANEDGTDAIIYVGAGGANG